jgi:GntR family transcriptional regulator
MMVKLDPASKKPIYEQIVQEVKSLVMTGKLLPHEQVLSVQRSWASIPIRSKNHTRSSSGKASFTL